MFNRRPDISVEHTSPLFPALSGFLLAFAMTGHASAADPHVHGLAQLQIGAGADRLDLLFVSPAANLVGFEHAPRTEQQRHAIRETFDFFRTEPLVENSSANCTIAEVSISGGPRESESHDEHPHEHHHDDPEASHAGHGKAHAGHAQEHGQELPEHSDIVVSQVLNCDGDWREGLRTTLLEQFEGIESLQVQWAGESGQGSAVLTQGDSRLEL